MIKKSGFLFLLLLSLSFALWAEGSPDMGAGKEIPNQLSAVKAANPGDYILLPSGKRYVLTKQEIEIAAGTFNYNDLSGVNAETRSDGTKVLSISQSHIVYNYPDGQSSHLFKTETSFSSFMNYLLGKYYITHYMDYVGNSNDYMRIGAPSFSVFRANVQFQNISNGTEVLESVTITAYNYKGENYVMKLCSSPDFIWGNVEGTFKPVGEIRENVFDIN
ncbi:MAG: hypothetical protein FWD78_07005 [Treponema sp.]|nr:hypothetical protein [Treponema sp.]